MQNICGSCLIKMTARAWIWDIIDAGYKFRTSQHFSFYTNLRSYSGLFWTIVSKTIVTRAHSHWWQVPILLLIYIKQDDQYTVNQSTVNLTVHSASQERLRVQTNITTLPTLTSTSKSLHHTKSLQTSLLLLLTPLAWFLPLVNSLSCSVATS